MELQFEKDLPHQKAAVEKILQVTETLLAENSLNYCANRVLYPNDAKIKTVIDRLQKSFRRGKRALSAQMRNLALPKIHAFTLM